MVTSQSKPRSMIAIGSNFTAAIVVALFTLMAVYNSSKTTSNLQMKKLAFEEMNYPAWILDSDNRYIWANKALFEMLHTTEEQFIGKTIDEIYKDPAFVTQMKGINKYILETGDRVQVKQRFIDSDGKVETFIITREKLRLNGHYGIAGVSLPFPDVQNLPEITVPLDVKAVE